MKLHNIIINTSFEEIWPYLKEMHKNYCPVEDPIATEYLQYLQSEYKNTLSYISALTPSPYDNKMKIHVDLVVDDMMSTPEGDVMVIDICGVKENDVESKFDLALEYWNRWLSMEIDDYSTHNFAKEQIIAACLYEMTYYGFTEEEIDKTREWLNVELESYEDNNLESIPFEDLFPEDY